MPEIMTAKELAKYLKLHEITIWKHAGEGNIPGIRIGSSWRFNKEAIDKWISEAQRKRPIKRPRKSKPKARAKVTKRSATASPSGAVLAIIKRSRKGADITTLKNKTGLEGRRVNDIIYKLKKEGKIKSVGRGIYVKT